MHAVSWPAVAPGKAGFGASREPRVLHLKDKLENKLHRLVCSGQMTLRAAQRGIASD
jgi:hypothetical protein